MLHGIVILSLTEQSVSSTPVQHAVTESQQPLRLPDHELSVSSSTVIVTRMRMFIAISVSCDGFICHHHHLIYDQCDCEHIHLVEEAESHCLLSFVELPAKREQMDLQVNKCYDSLGKEGINITSIVCTLCVLINLMLICDLNMFEMVTDIRITHPYIVTLILKKHQDPSIVDSCRRI